MRPSLFVVLTAAVLFSWPGPAVGQIKDQRIRIDKVHVGFPSAQFGEADSDGRDTPLYKSGAWAPVYVDISVGILGLGQSEAERPYKFEVVVETNDSDGISNNYIVALPVLDPKQSITVLTYVRTGNSNAENVTVHIRERKHDDESGRNICQSQANKISPLDPGQVLYLTIGSRMSGLRRSLRPTDNPGGLPVVQEHVAYLDAVEQMPEHWWGYEGVDVVFLNTSDRDFVMSLLNRDPDDRRKRALADWVRHGGRLVVAAGRNQDVVSQIPELSLVLPVNLRGTIPLPKVQPVWDRIPFNQPIVNQPSKNNPAGQPPPVEVTRLERKAGRALEVLMRAQGPAAEGENAKFLDGGRPLIVRGSHGLGQVVVVALDLDLPPFITWGSHKEFWQKLLTKLGPGLPSDAQSMRGLSKMGGAGYNWRDDSNDLVVQLQNHLENFEDVPVISFGWVALFIFIYILVVGPLDYFILKKVVKRLELTWITFPVVVLSVSAIAYFTAYWLKGNDLRINKVDVVDIDLHTQQAYGSTWLTIFSPRIQHYTIGVEPAAPDWVKAPDDGKPLPAMVTWLGRPEPGWRGGGRARGQSLFRRAYDYDDRAAGLKGVPIQVWSTKSFTASWHGAFDQTRPLLRVRDAQRKDGALSPVPNSDKLLGSITWQLSVGGDAAVELQDAVLVHRKSIYRLRAVQPGQELDIGEVLKPQDSAGVFPSGLLSAFSSANPSSGTLNGIVRRVLFGDESPTSGTAGGTSLRYLDETWRTPALEEEAILVGRLAPLQGQAEDVSQNPTSVTRLWLGKLPNSGERRDRLVGTLKQDTYVRVYIPVRPAR